MKARFLFKGEVMEHKSDRKWRLEKLLQKHKSKQKLSYGVLFEECLDALGEGTIILSEESSETMRNELVNAYYFTPWGRIDWDKISKKTEIKIAADVLYTLKSLNIDIGTPIYIIWSGSYPVLQTDFQRFINALDDVLAVDFDTYVYCSSHYVIEFFHDGEITLGYL
ncbi:hypothetical protein ASG89_18305 [Paenibacillus sp. Soil766]|uniref:CDI toxin immunity protein n=1 Tax=Paenibacillus sp. Soil766 TaxID=1736404 RepID=UPI00070AD329|nr:hypothetical protein [Paenibacillus sp. Soil766]KRF06805.1 hypothetical protein ASG89_18305 [Paenibacillus sp. Soil766]